MTTNGAVGDVVTQWYASCFGRDDGQARAARARLRRCQSPLETLTVAETHELSRLLRNSGNIATPDQLALLATTFARLRDIRGNKMATIFGGRRTQDDPRLLSELRFQSLIRARSHRDLMTPLRRSLAVLGSNPACDGRALARDLYYWDEYVRSKWCFQYFGAEFAAPNEGETV